MTRTSIARFRERVSRLTIQAILALLSTLVAYSAATFCPAGPVWQHIVWGYRSGRAGYAGPSFPLGLTGASRRRRFVARAWDAGFPAYFAVAARSTLLCDREQLPVGVGAPAAAVPSDA